MNVKCTFETLILILIISLRCASASHYFLGDGKIEADLFLEYWEDQKFWGQSYKRKKSEIFFIGHNFFYKALLRFGYSAMLFLWHKS